MIFVIQPNFNSVIFTVRLGFVFDVPLQNALVEGEVDVFLVYRVDSDLFFYFLGLFR